MTQLQRCYTSNSKKITSLGRIYVIANAFEKCWTTCWIFDIVHIEIEHLLHFCKKL